MVAIPAIGLFIRDSRDDSLRKESLWDRRSNIWRSEGLKEESTSHGVSSVKTVRVNLSQSQAEGLLQQLRREASGIRRSREMLVSGSIKRVGPNDQFLFKRRLCLVLG